MDRFVDQLDAIAIFIVIDFNYEQTEIVGRYAGRAPGHIAVPMPNNISDTRAMRFSPRLGIMLPMRGEGKPS